MSVHTYTNKKMPTGMWGQDDRWSLSGTNSAESPPGIRQRQRVKGKEETSETKGGQQMDRAEKKSCLG